MKKIYLLVALMISFTSYGQDMVITGTFDGPLPGGVPKLIEVYVINDITDLSTFGIGSANNGGGTDGEELSFAGSATAGDFIYIGYEGTTTPNAVSIYFGITADYIGNAANNNGDDALELFSGGVVIDTFGTIDCDPNASGSTCPEWEYTDGWAYRNNSTGPDGASFALGSWSFSGVNAADGCTTNATCASVFPIGTFTYSGTPCGVSLGAATYACSTNTIGDNNDGVTVEIPYTGSNGTITSVTTTSGGTVSGDPATVADGTITITGLSEGDAWDITLNGGDCDATTVSGTVPADQCDPAPNTCFDISTGTDLFELVVVTANSSSSNNGTWEYDAGTYSANAYCGSGCAEPVESWLIFGPLDMTSVTDLALAFDATKNFTETELIVAYTDAYSGCPSSSTWTTAQTLTATGSYDVDFSAATGTDVFIGIQYVDDGVDGYSGWSLSNVALEAFGNCPPLGQKPISDCAVCDLVLQTETYTCLSNTAGANNDAVTVEIPYSGSEDTITSITTTVQANIEGDDPTVTADGTITITGLSEGDAWDLTINGGDCDATTVSGTIPAITCDPVTMDLVINELLADPDATTGDANGDGTIDTSQDEFIEFYNVGASALDISGYTVEDFSEVRHTFPASTIIPAGGFLTLFGNGTPTGIMGISQVASTGSVGLNNSGDTVTVKNSAGAIVVTYTYGSEGSDNQSLAREPDFTGDFVKHLLHTTNPVQFSPGRMNNDATMSIGENSLSNLTIFPNPTNTGFINIMTSNSELINVKVFDILGKQVIKSNVENNQLNVSGLSAGVYILKLTQNNASTTKKLVIK